MSDMDKKINTAIKEYQGLRENLKYYDIQFEKSIKKLNEIKGWGNDISEKSKFERFISVLRTTHYALIKRSLYFVSQFRDILWSYYIDLPTDDVRNIEKYATDKIIEAEATKEMLHVTLPLLYKRTLFKSHYYYDKELRIKLDELSIQKVLPYFKEKQINFINVYSMGYKGQIPDNDNLDTKGIIDTICDYVSFGDSGLSTILTFRSIKTDAVPEGTHVIVTSKDENYRNYLI